MCTELVANTELPIGSSIESMVHLVRVRELESERHARVQDAKSVMLHTVRSERQPTPEEQAHLHDLRQQHSQFERELQAVFDDA
jgi:hypothetical protein